MRTSCQKYQSKARWDDSVNVQNKQTVCLTYVDSSMHFLCV